MPEPTDEKRRAFEELLTRLDPETIDLIAKSDPSTWKGTCFSGVGCTGAVMTGGGAVTISGCVALGGASWRGSWKGAGCINV